MGLLKNKRDKLPAACIRITAALFDTGYITEKEKIWLIDRVNRGDKTAYKDLRIMLLQMAATLERE